MEVTVQHEKREILVQTVSLVHNDNEPENLYLFRCPYCSTGVTQIQGLVGKISPGVEPTADVTVIHQCQKCKRLYTFQTLEGLNKKNANVTLISVPGAIGIFYCWICRNPLVQFIEDRAVKLPDFSLIHIPSTMDCVNPTCPAKYRITDIVRM